MNEQQIVERWNAQHPVGTPVVAYPGCRPEDDRNATRIVTTTRSRADVLSGHTAVVWVHGHSACIALTHIDVVFPPRGGHSELCAYAAGMSSRCTCEPEDGAK